MRLLLLCLLAVTFASPVNAAETTWTPIKISAWKGKQDGPGRYDLSAGLVETDIDLKPLEGQWVRIGATASAGAPDFWAWVHVFDADNKAMGRVMPTTCELSGKRKRCHTIAWVRPGAARLRLGFYSNFVPVEITPDSAEWAPAQAVTPQNLARYTALRQSIRDRYFRSGGFDWTMSALEQGALNAPDGVDPVPHALRDLINRLPDNKHTNLLVDNQSAPLTMPLVLPTCAQRADGSWLLHMPSTPAKMDDNARYVEAGHDCIARAPGGKWLIDLSDHGGGNTMLTFAALAPVLGIGNMMMYLLPNKNQEMLSLTRQSVIVGGNVNVQWEKKTVPFAGSATFLIGPGCMSACESIAIAVKGRYKTIGQPTGGYTSVNDTIRINPSMQIALTIGMQADANGKTYDTVAPDEMLDEQQMATMTAASR